MNPDVKDILRSVPSTLKPHLQHLLRILRSWPQCSSLLSTPLRLGLRHIDAAAELAIGKLRRDLCGRGFSRRRNRRSQQKRHACGFIRSATRVEVCFSLFRSWRFQKGSEPQKNEGFHCGLVVVGLKRPRSGVDRFVWIVVRPPSREQISKDIVGGRVVLQKPCAVGRPMDRNFHGRGEIFQH